MLKRFVRSGLALVAMLLAGTAAAQSQWPNKPVKFINPYAAGGGVDAFSRPLAARLTTSLGQTFIVENIPGAGGTLGASQAAKAAPDGYTFFVGAIHHTIAEAVYPKLTYNIERDFEPVTVLAYVPNVVVMHPKHANIRTLQDLITH